MRRILAALSFASMLHAQDVVLPDGKAKDLIQNSCTDCHGLDQVVSNAMSREEWRKTVNLMVKRGAPLEPAQIDTVVDYLSVYFAPDRININTATAKELQGTLGLTETEAKAVIDQRTKAKIADLPALTKVPGVDAKKIDLKKDLIIF